MLFVSNICHHESDSSSNNHVAVNLTRIFVNINHTCLDVKVLTLNIVVGKSNPICSNLVPPFVVLQKNINVSVVISINVSHHCTLGPYDRSCTVGIRLVIVCLIKVSPVSINQALSAIN